eukprot:Nitzschia sp. Nitz4//scaffold69_size99277//70319//72115//NITZ4_004642-RA/size99277-processed-gene-0.39-mRNA-1//-1//CDS//3329556742//3278//frame0
MVVESDFMMAESGQESFVLNDLGHVSVCRRGLIGHRPPPSNVLPTRDDEEWTGTRIPEIGMCGINLQVWGSNLCPSCQLIRNDNTALDNLQHRGPDACQSVELSLPNRSQSLLNASVLRMRKTLQTQPLTISSDKSVSYFCWNGEVYEATECGESGGDYETSDTQLVASQLERHAFQDNSLSPERVASVFGSLFNAEFAFILVDSNKILFGRDAWGRRSLLRWHCPHEGCGSFQIVSTPETLSSETDITPQTWEEILPGKVHCLAVGESSTVSMTSNPISLSSFDVPRPLSGFDSPAPPDVSEDIWRASLELEFHLSNAVLRRMDHSADASNVEPIPTGVLFSGGLDSAVVAALAAKHCHEKLILFNVSFGPTYEKSADRQAALVTHQFLQDLYPHKDIVFEDVVVDWEEICQLESHIRTLLQPKCTLMDVNIATALWFASRGRQPSQHNCPPRVLLLGMGADEQLGGYGRHRKAFEKGGWDELRSELVMDQDRFWERNLGRDDRIVADHGKEARFPFLDAHVTNFLQSLPLNQVCDFSLPPGEGDKRILRLVASRLGLVHASTLVKRAIQFGSRISHLSDAKRFGSRRKAKGEKQVQ